MWQPNDEEIIIKRYTIDDALEQFSNSKDLQSIDDEHKEQYLKYCILKGEIERHKSLPSPQIIVNVYNFVICAGYHPFITHEDIVGNLRFPYPPWLERTSTQERTST
jgi:hypothetical protein